MSADTAEENCILRGGHLVSIHSEIENLVFMDMARDEGWNDTYTGLQVKNSRHQWTDGSQLYFMEDGFSLDFIKFPERNPVSGQAGLPSTWPTVTTEQECLEICRTIGCHIYTWHATVPGAWEHVCVSWTFEEADSHGRAYSQNWSSGQTGYLVGMAADYFEISDRHPDWSAVITSDGDADNYQTTSSLDLYTDLCRFSSDCHIFSWHILDVSSVWSQKCVIWSLQEAEDYGFMDFTTWIDDVDYQSGTVGLSPKRLDNPILESPVGHVTPKGCPSNITRIEKKCTTAISSSQSHVWCCGEGFTDICATPDPTCSGLLSYSEAETYCSTNGREVCSVDQILDSECCGTGCCYDAQRVL